MKKFLFYIVLPSVVLCAVYQMGRSSVGRPALERESVPAASSENSDTRKKVPSGESAPARKAAPRRIPLEPVPLPAAQPQLQPLSIGKSALLPDDPGPKVVATRDNLGQPVYGIDYPPAVDVPAPIPSVYESLGAKVPAKPSELGLLPLVSPEQAAKVYSGPQPVVKKTTYTESSPVAAPVFPAVSPAPAVRVVSPVRITSSSQCDCGKEH